MGEVAIGGRRQTDRLLRPFRLTSSPRWLWLICSNFCAYHSWLHCYGSWSLSARCCLTTTTSRSQQRSLLSRLLLDTRRVLWIDRHLKQTRNRQGQTDRPLVQSDNRLCIINRQDRIQGTQTHTLENTVFILAKYLNLGASLACMMHI